jgi:hypothetical protein
MTINLTEEQVSYLQGFVSEKLEENLDLEEAEMLHDLADKLYSDYYDDDDGEDDVSEALSETDVEPFTKEDFDEAFGDPKDLNQIDMFDTEPE